MDSHKFQESSDLVSNGECFTEEDRVETNADEDINIDSKLYNYHFNIRIFLKFLIIYFLFLFGFGPVIMLLYFIRKDFILLYNIIEITSKGNPFIKVIFNLIIPFLYVVYFEGFLTFQIAEIHMLSATLIFITVSQSAMISYTYDEIEEDLSKKRISTPQLARLTSVGNYTIKEELKNIVLRLNVDIYLLYFSFLGEKSGSPPFMPKTSQNEDNLVYYKRANSVMESENDYTAPPQSSDGFTKTLYDRTKSYGENLALHLLESLPDNSRTKQALLLSFFQSLIPVTYQALADKPSPSQSAQFIGYIVLIVAFWFLNFYCSYYVMDILMFALANIKRRIFLMEEMGDLIAPHVKKRNGAEKVYHLNFLDPMSLRTWLSIRKILMRYGDRDMKTVTLSITLVMGFHIVMIIFTVLNIFGVLDFGSSAAEDGIIFGLGSIIYFVLLLQLIWSGASLNKQYNTHRELLHTNKSIMISLIRLYPDFVDKKPLRPQTYIYQTGLEKLKEEFKENNSIAGERQLKVHILTETYDDLLEDLIFEEINRPFRLMGIAMTSTLTKSLIAGLFSIVTAITPKLLSAINSSSST